jgi:hypothetical protein
VGPGTRKAPGFFGRRRADKAYAAWREQMAKVFGSQGDHAPLWDDGPALDYVTDRPGWEGLAGLLLKYASLLHPEHPLPEVPVGSLVYDQEPVFLAAMAKPCSFMGLAAPLAWFPSPFGGIFFAPLVDGPASPCSTLSVLDASLDECCALWGKDRAEMARLETAQPSKDAPIDDAALHGLAVFCRLADEATRRNLPMIVDS